VTETRFASVEDYLTSLESPKQETLRSVLEGIQLDYPTAELKIAWNVPQVQISGKYVFGVSSARKNLSLAPWSDAVMADFAQRLTGYETTKGLIRIPVDWNVDHELIRDLIRARLDELGIPRD
jgi:uncharacterized protein YdhG (YjbR/CyaY superfamily)